MQNLSAAGVMLRFLFALLLVLCTYNPSGYSFFHWLITTWDAPTPWLALAGVVLAIAWVIYIRASLRSLGPVGLTLASALMACLIWVLIDLGLVSLDNTSVMTWIIEVLIACVLGIGICWSHIRRRLSGQVDADDVDN